MTSATRPITLRDELACAKRELRMRQDNYPRWVARGTMNQHTCDWQIACMAAIVQRLEAAQKAEETQMQLWEPAV